MGSTDAILVCALAALAGIAYTLKVWQSADADSRGGGLTFDATIVIALVGLSIAGPVVAFALWLVPDFLHRVVFRRAPLLTRGLVVNALGFGVGVLAGAGVLAYLGGFAGLYLAGLAMAAANFGFSGALYSVLWEGPGERRALLAEFVAFAPAAAAMVALGAATALLAEPAGALALIALAVAVVLPELLWDRALARAGEIIAEARRRHRLTFAPSVPETDATTCVVWALDVILRTPDPTTRLVLLAELRAELAGAGLDGRLSGALSGASEWDRASELQASMVSLRRGADELADPGEADALRLVADELSQRLGRARLRSVEP